MDKLILSILFVFSALLLNAQEFTIDNIAYEIVSSESVKVISKTPKYTGDIIIPSTVSYKGNIYVVKHIGANAFEWCTSLTSVSIPNWVTQISNYSFSNCTALESVTIGYSVENIGTRAFNNCAKLKTVKFSGAVQAIKTIGKYAFNDCHALISINLPNSLTTIEEGAFYNCIALTEITIPANIKEIKNETFYNCQELRTLSFSNSITSIGISAFSHCSKLSSMEIPTSTTSIGDYAFANCIALTDLNLNNVVTIGKSAFFFCNSLKSLTIPNTVTTIDDWAFRGISSASIHIGSSVEYIGDRAFQAVSNLEEFSVSTLNNFFSDFQGVLFDKSKNKLIQCPAEKTTLEIPNTVSTIGAYAFSFCSKLNKIIIPIKITYIGDYGFSDCTGLTMITSNAEEPPSLGIDVFNGVTKSIPLNVPLNSKDVYLNALQWNEFTINPTPTDITESRLSTAKVVQYSNMVILSIENIRINDQVFIHNTSGKLIYNSIIPYSTFKIDLNNFEPGLYILSIFNGKEKFSTKIVR